MSKWRNGHYELLKITTDEQWTGRYWNDGKKIYTKIVVIYENWNVNPSLTYSGQSITGWWPANLEFITNYKLNNLGADTNHAVSGLYYDGLVGGRSLTRRATIYLDGQSIFIDTGYYIKDSYLIIEYTKTTN